MFQEAAAKERLAAGEEIWSYTALCQGSPHDDTPFWELDLPPAPTTRVTEVRTKARPHTTPDLYRGLTPISLFVKWLRREFRGNSYDRLPSQALSVAGCHVMESVIETKAATLLEC
jgi:hypothetical protein